MAWLFFFFFLSWKTQAVLQIVWERDRANGGSGEGFCRAWQGSDIQRESCRFPAEDLHCRLVSVPRCKRSTNKSFGACRRVKKKAGRGRSSYVRNTQGGPLAPRLWENKQESWVPAMVCGRLAWGREKPQELPVMGGTRRSPRSCL